MLSVIEININFKMKIKYAIAATSLSLILSACDKNPTTSDTSTSQKTQEQALKELSIGYQKAALKLIVAKKNQSFEQAFPSTKVSWKEFPAGPQTLEALSVGAIDFGYTGDVPVVFALAADKPLRYLVAEQSSRQAHALLIPNNSQIQTLTDLKGKRIGLTKGSSAHYFVSETLKQAGLTWQDIQPVWLTPADARAALDKNAIDAWAIWEPYISATETQGNAKILFDSKTLPAVYSFYSAQPQFKTQYPQAVNQIKQVLNETDDWIEQHPEETAQILSESTGLSLDIARAVIQKKPSPNQVDVPSLEIIQAQQKVADSFYQLKLMPKAVDIQNTAAQ